MKVISLKNIPKNNIGICPDREFKSYRYLVDSDNMGYTITRTELPVGSKKIWHYKNHLESCLCIKGSGKLIDKETEEVYNIEVGTLYAPEHDRHKLIVHEKMVLICVFNPPLKGNEVHKKDGSYEN